MITLLHRFSRSVSFIAHVMKQGIGFTIAEMPLGERGIGDWLITAGQSPVGG